VPANKKKPIVMGCFLCQHDKRDGEKKNNEP